MEEKIKGLEENIQAYINEHSGCQLTVELSRDVSHNGEYATSEWFAWKVTVKHKPTKI